MYTLYKDGEEASVERDQLSLMKDSGWSEAKPEEVVVGSETEEELAAKAAAEKEAAELAAKEAEAKAAAEKEQAASRKKKDL